MATSGQIGGMLLEEIVLFLLRGSGYSTVDTAMGDNTLEPKGDSILVKGRGSDHQIDAIADYRYPPPFGQPHRLLVEAKLLGKKVGIDIIRNALGVHRDVSEYWVGRTTDARGVRPRHHYQYAIFSATDFSKPAQDFAFAQDIYLLALHDLSVMAPVIQNARSLAEDLAPSTEGANGVTVTELRRTFRRLLRQQVDGAENLAGAFAALISLCRDLNTGFLGMLQSRMPIFLVPAPDLNPETLADSETVRIYWDDDGWYVRRDNEVRLFSFQLPHRLFSLYSRQGLLDPRDAIDLKLDAMNSIVFFHARPGGGGRFVELRLDTEWLNAVRERLATNDDR